MEKLAPLKPFTSIVTRLKVSVGLKISLLKFFETLHFVLTLFLSDFLLQDSHMTLSLYLGVVFDTPNFLSIDR